jgi:hypothetical protein
MSQCPICKKNESPEAIISIFLFKSGEIKIMCNSCLEHYLIKFEEPPKR